jgi:hypothetical protein
MAYRTYDPATVRVTVTRDVIFDDEVCWQCVDGEFPST